MIDLIEIFESSTESKKFSLRKVYLNPDRVLCMTECEKTKKMQKDGNLDLDLDQNHSFTRVTMDSGGFSKDLIIVGSPAEIKTKINHHKKLLFG